MSDDYKDIFEEMEKYWRRMFQNIQKNFEQMDANVKTGKLQGKWEVTPISEPGVHGYVAYGEFRSPDLLPTQPKRLFSQDKAREPLVDVIEEEKAVKVYAEVPGVEKDQIKVDTTEGVLEIRAGEKFHSRTRVPEGLDIKKATATYKNGVLELIIPRTQIVAKKDKQKIPIQ